MDDVIGLQSGQITAYGLEQFVLQGRCSLLKFRDLHGVV